MPKKLTLETHMRARVKSIVWRILGIIILGLVSWLVTHSWKEATVITLIFNGVQVILYYFHERAWGRVSWGRIRRPLSDVRLNQALTMEDKRRIEETLKSLGYVD